MSSFFKDSLLSECVLNKYNFESAIALGLSKKEILEMFAISLSPQDLGQSANIAMLDIWCKENYDNIGFDHIFALIQAATIKKYSDCMLELGIRGNPSAIALMNDIILKKQSQSVVQVNFVNTLPQETDQDKEDDEC